MKKIIFLIFTFGILLSLSAPASDVLAKLNSLNKVSAKETTTPADQNSNLRRFIISFEQKIDHFDAHSKTFHQKLVLFHRDFSEPMVLQTSGYSIFSERMSRLANTFATNQLQVEHRYFASSSPDPKDWSKLDIRQSAEDFHAIVTTFKNLYNKNWVGTGASKGGMTSIYHRRFFPDDLDGTVADVAPLSFSIEDSRYIDFVDNVGGAVYAKCRKELDEVQRSLLKNKQEILDYIKGEFNQLGSKEIGFEHAVTEMPFIFWQYSDPEEGAANCYNIPSEKASAKELYNFLEYANSPAQYADETLDSFLPYYFQAAIELGAPAAKRSHMLDLLLHPYNILQYTPKNQKTIYDDSAMKDIASWVAKNAEGLMFIYGEFDPWTAGAFKNIRQGDNHLFVVENGNHGATFSKLSGKSRDRALSILSRWFNKSQVHRIEFNFIPLEDLELNFRKTHRARHL